MSSGTEMGNPNDLLSQIVAFRTYARHLPVLGRRETLEETIDRKLTMDVEKYPKMAREIVKAYDLVHELKVMPSMRGLQFGGLAIQKNNVRQYNCSFRLINDVRAFSEVLFLLLSGTGVGFSVQKSHISQLPKVRPPVGEGYFAVHDSIEGWAQALDLLVDAYLLGRIRPQFDFFQVRPKGSYLMTTGARAPGPEPLKHMLAEVESRLKAAVGRQLKDVEVHDIICIISDCVLAGGIRRAALISLFDRSSKEMLKCKSGSWWEKHPYRARANNSAVLPRDTVTFEEFQSIFEATQKSGAGEPGFSWTDDMDWGFNPCHEISIRNKQFCNLTTVNQTGIKSKKDFLERVSAAALLGTIQASYTNFHYLTDEWRSVTEEEALIGVSFTGVADAVGIVTNDWLREGAAQVLGVNERIAKKIGINIASRTTTNKPEGSSSAVIKSASGIHARHARPYYLRRVRMNKDDALTVYLRSMMPELVEDEVGSSTGAVITIPQMSPEGSISRDDETALQLFGRALDYNVNWVAPGHRSGANRNNVSCTISVKDNEWEDLGKAMWENRSLYSGISLLPFDGGNYKQAPFETCDQGTYEKYAAMVKDVDLRNVHEEEDMTTRNETVACGGGACEAL